jgi:demethylmenaquinone methyltransferase/2-methoxy-6-polyprenyl-1,4-benzoquinol methylase
MSLAPSPNDFRAHVLSYYNRFATLYDLAEFIRRGTRRKALSWSGWRRGDKVLDVCTGTGELALTFSRQGAEVLGTDLTRGMLRRAASKSRGLRLGWAEMDAADLGFAAGSFDISLLSLALHHMPVEVQVRVLGEMRRVTRRRVVIVEPHAPLNPRFRRIWIRAASLLDESEHLHEWAHQDFVGTCRSAGLNVQHVQITTLGIHRITVCSPAGGDPQN